MNEDKKSDGDDGGGGGGNGNDDRIIKDEIPSKESSSVNEAIREDKVSNEDLVTNSANIPEKELATKGRGNDDVDVEMQQDKPKLHFQNQQQRLIRTNNLIIALITKKSRSKIRLTKRRKLR